MSRRPPKRRNPAGGRGPRKAQRGKLQANPTTVFCPPYSQVLTGGTVLPHHAIHDGLLTNGPKRYRVLVQVDHDGRLLPVALVVDNDRQTVTEVPTETLDTLSEHVGSPEQAQQLRRWAITYRAEQAGMGGRA